MPDSSNVVEFPDYSVAQWLPYERMLRESFNASGRMSPEVVEDMLARLRPIFLKRAQQANAHPGAQDDAPNMLVRVQAWVAQLVAGLLTDIAEREAKLIDYGET